MGKSVWNNGTVKQGDNPDQFTLTGFGTPLRFNASSPFGAALWALKFADRISENPCILFFAEGSPFRMHYFAGRVMVRQA